MCGILCVKTHNIISLESFLVELNKLQHRGQNSFGYFCKNKENISYSYIPGLIKHYKDYINLNGTLFLGHIRYVTSGSKDIVVNQPVIGENKFGRFCFVFNGNINLDKYNKLLNTDFSVDTLLIKYYFENCDKEFETIDKLIESFITLFTRAYSIIFYLIDLDNIYLFRDKYGVRPLQYFKSGDNIKIASEFSYNTNQVNAGEIIFIDNKSNIKSIYQYKGKTNTGNCLFEYIYFMNKDTYWNNINVERIREEYGKYLSKTEIKKIIDNKNDYVVIGIPNSGIPSAKSYADNIGITYKQLIVKNKNIDRTFILNSDKERIKTSKLKYIFSDEIKNKNLILFDDSIVRGITIKTLISNLKSLNVKEIHIRIASPQIKYTCSYGIDIPEKESLLVNNFNNITEIEKFIGCDSLKYLDIEEFVSIMPNYNNLCSGCFNNDYKNLEW